MDSPSSSSLSPPRLLRSMTEKPLSSLKDVKSSEGAAASSSKPTSNSSTEDLAKFAYTQQPQPIPLDQHDATASSASPRHGKQARVRTRSVSSHAVPVSQLARTAPTSFRVEEVAEQLGRGPGTPDFVLPASTPHWRRVDYERNKTLSSLGQGLQLISESEKNAGASSSILGHTGRPRSSSDASASSTSSSSPKKKSAGPISLPRPRLSSLRSFFSSFSGSTPTTPYREASPDDDSDHQPRPPVSKALPLRPQPLVMPSARPAGPNGLRGLNEDSPPLTPTSESDDQSEYAQYLRAFQNGGIMSKQVPKYHGAPKHQWSAAQAAADAAQLAYEDRHTVTPPHPSQWPFTPPLTTSTSASPVTSIRTFSPPTRPDSTMFSAGGPQSLLPSHLVSAFEGGSRPPTPTSTLTASSDRSTRGSYNLFDVDTYRMESMGKSISALLPRIQINLSSWRLSMPNLRPYLPRLVFLFVVFVAATSCVIFMLSTLPLTLPEHITSLTLTEIKQLALSLKDYSESSTSAFTHTLLVIGAFFTWKQSFTIPGSLIMNVVFGAMYGTYWGTLYTSTLTALGGVFCYLLSAPLAPLITSLPGLAKPLNAMRRALSPARAHASGRSVMISNSRNTSDGNVWTYLLVLRVLPIVPYGLMNIACGVLGVPLLPYAGTLAIGSIPWNFVTCQVGDLLQEIVEALPVQDDLTMSGLKHQAVAEGGMKAIVDHIWNREMMVKLILLSIASLLPMLLSRYLKYRQRLQNEGQGYEPVEHNEDMANHRSDEENDRAGSRRTSQYVDQPISMASLDRSESDKDRRSHVRETTDRLYELSQDSSNHVTGNGRKSRLVTGSSAWL